jgi:hypothetical protein
MDAKAVEVETNDVATNNSVVVVPKISIVVSLVDIGCDEDKKEYSIELDIILVAVVSISLNNVVLVSDDD